MAADNLVVRFRVGKHHVQVGRLPLYLWLWLRREEHRELWGCRPLVLSQKLQLPYDRSSRSSELILAAEYKIHGLGKQIAKMSESIRSCEYDMNVVRQPFENLAMIMRRRSR